MYLFIHVWGFMDFSVKVRRNKLNCLFNPLVAWQSIYWDQFLLGAFWEQLCRIPTNCSVFRVLLPKIVSSSLGNWILHFCSAVFRFTIKRCFQIHKTSLCYSLIEWLWSPYSKGKSQGLGVSSWSSTWVGPAVPGACRPLRVGLRVPGSACLSLDLF